MVEHPRDYPWSSYGFNAQGKDNPLLVPHTEYKRLGNSANERQKAYRALFKARIPEQTLSDIRGSTNKAWVLGSDKFKKKIEQQLNRRTRPLAKGGDRKSAAYRKNNINLDH